MEAMLGMVFMVPWEWAPMDYQRCAGQTLTVGQYAALFSLMGNRFGGNGSNNFALPNLQGRVPVGYGVSPVSGAVYNLAATGGTEGTVLSVNNMPPHNHGAVFNATQGSQTVTIPATPGSLSVTAGVGVNTTAATNTSPGALVTNGQTAYLTNAGAFSGSTNLLRGLYTTAAPTTGATATMPVATTVSGSAGTAATTTTISAVTGGSVTIGSNGSGQAFTNLPPFQVMNFIIAVNGLYPSRN